MTRRLALSLLSFAPCALGLAGCASPDQRFIQTRRDPTEVERERDAQRELTPEEIDERFLVAEEERRLTPQLRESLVYLDLIHKSVRGTMGSIKPDPWVVAEADCKRVLYREWADHPEGLAVVEPPEPEEAEQPAEGEGEKPAEGEGEGEKPAEGDSEE